MDGGLHGAGRLSAAAALAAGEAGDDGVEDHGDARDDGVQYGGDGIDDGGQAGADGREDGLDLWVGRLVSEVWWRWSDYEGGLRCS